MGMVSARGGQARIKDHASRINMSPEIQACIQALADNNNGRITPDIVIEAARDSTSPLHTQFNWDVEQAAYSHWRDVARNIIASVRVEIRSEKMVIKTVAYVRDPTKEHNEQGYISVAVIRNDAELAAKAFVYEFGRAEAALTRAEEVAAALSLEPEVKRIAKRVSTLRDRVSQQYA